MRLIDADVILKNLKETEEDLLRQADSFEKLLTLSMVQFAETVIERFAERSDTHGGSG